MAQFYLDLVNELHLKSLQAQSTSPKEREMNTLRDKGQSCSMVKQTDSPKIIGRHYVDSEIIVIRETGHCKLTSQSTCTYYRRSNERHICRLHTKKADMFGQSP